MENRNYDADLKKRGKKPVILVCGYTGSGKTSIMQSILDEIVLDTKIGHDEPMTQGYEKYENERIKIWESKGLDSHSGEDAFIEITKNFIHDAQGKKTELSSETTSINVFWYVIQSSAAKITNTDLKIIDTLPHESTIVVISKSDTTKSVQIDAMKNKLTEQGIDSNKILAVSVDNYNEKISENGIEKLTELTRSIMPKEYKVVFGNV